MRPLAFSGFVLAALLWISCSPDHDSSAEKRPLIVTTILPLQFVVDRLVGPTAEVICLAQPNTDPLEDRPDRAQLAQLHTANLIVLQGAGAEHWVGSVNLPLSRVLDTTANLQLRLLTRDGGVPHDHGDGKMHVHGDGHPDPYTWLDPDLLLAQTRSVRSRLQTVLPADAQPLVDRNMAAIERSLNDIGREFRELGERRRNDTVFSTHPGYGYLARLMGWTVVDLELDPAALPDTSTMARVQARVNRSPGSFLIWERSPEPAVARRYSDGCGLETLVLATMEPDYIEMMRGNAVRLRRAMDR